jgi:hypothetical protein
MTASDNEELITDFDWWMESSCTRFGAILVKSDLFPWKCLKVEGPNIVHIGHTLTSKNNKVWVEQFGCMICSLPGCFLVLLGDYLGPLLSFPVQQVNRVESLFIRGASTIKHDTVILFIVAHRAIWPMRRNITGGLYFGPIHGQSVVRPYVIHVCGIGIPTEEYNSLSDETTAVAPSRGRMRWGFKVAVCLVPRVFFHEISF